MIVSLQPRNHRSAAELSRKSAYGVEPNLLYPHRHRCQFLVGVLAGLVVVEPVTEEYCDQHSEHAKGVRQCVTDHGSTSCGLWEKGLGAGQSGGIGQRACVYTSCCGSSEIEE